MNKNAFAGMNGNMIKVKANEIQLNYIYILFFKLK